MIILLYTLPLPYFMHTKFIQSFLVLLAVWVLLAGWGNGELAAGVFFSLIIAYVSRDYIFENGIISKLHPMRFFHSASFFVNYSWGELTNHLLLCRIILSPRMNISPALVRAPFITKNHKVMTAISTAITLTPGTFTLAISDKDILMHCIDFKSMDAVGDMRVYEKNLIGAIE